jgi:hypothetical protein
MHKFKTSEIQQEYIDYYKKHLHEYVMTKDLSKIAELVNLELFIDDMEKTTNGRILIIKLIIKECLNWIKSILKQ